MNFNRDKYDSAAYQITNPFGATAAERQTVADNIAAERERLMADIREANKYGYGYDFSQLGRGVPTLGGNNEIAQLRSLASEAASANRFLDPVRPQIAENERIQAENEAYRASVRRRVELKALGMTSTILTSPQGDLSTYKINSSQINNRNVQSTLNNNKRTMAPNDDLQTETLGR